MGCLVTIQAHRGAGIGLPENTLESCVHTWTCRPACVVPEIDISTTAEGVIVGFHDKDLSRVVYALPAGFEGKSVSQLTWDEARTLDVGGTTGQAFVGQRIARIEDVFGRLHARPDRRLYLDFKSADLSALAAIARAIGVAKQIILASRHHEILLRWSTLLENAQTLQWIPHGGDEATLRAVIDALRSRAYAGLTQIQLHTEYKAGGEMVPSLDFIRRLAAELGARNILLQCFPYTGPFGGRTDPRAFATLLSAGVRSFATDHVDDALAQVEAFVSRQEDRS